MGCLSLTATTVSLRDVRHWIEAFAAEVADSKEHLTKLDSAIGDADHGVNMQRGMRKALEQLEASEPDGIGDLLKDVGMALTSKVGGAAGPLYGSFFLQVARTVGDGKDELTAEEWTEGLEAGVQGVVTRGKAQRGDKTMLDALLPAVEALREAVEDGADLSEATARTAAAAEEGMEATIPMVARKGRASYLGERSKGHQDPGATSSYLLLKAAAQAVGGEEAT